MKQRKCMAEGGIIMAGAEPKETPEAILARINAKYGLAAATAAPAPQPAGKQSPPAAEPAPQRTSVSPAEGIAAAIGRRTKELRKAANYARGGVMPVVGEGDEVDQRKQARSGGYKDGAVPLPQDDSAIRINQQAQTVYPGGIASFLSGVPDAIRAPTQPIGPNLAESVAPVGMSPQSQGLLTGIKDYSTTPAQLANSGKPAFVNEDGSARNMGPAVPSAAQQPLMTMRERDIAAGVDPGRAYRPGSAADPYASGNVSRAAAPASPFATDQQYSPLQPLDTRSRRQRRQAGFADGGLIPVDILAGLNQHVVKPIVEDWKRGNQAIKVVRDQYPTVDSVAGLHPAVAAAQVANDVFADQIGADTALNAAQAIPVVKGLSGMAKAMSKQVGPSVGGTKFVVDMPNTIRKNSVLTGGQMFGQPANAFADGGMVRFAGKGGPREDEIPVTVAGEHIKVSDGEAAVILPAKTAKNPAALGIIGQLIRATNDGRAPKMGIDDGEEYQRGALPVRQYPVAAPEPYRPNWTQPRNIPAQFAPPVVEGVVETVADQRAARMASQPRALNAPTNIVPPVSQPNWTAGGNPPNVGPIGGGQWANQGWSNPPERATMPQRGGIQSAVQALPGPAPEIMKASSDARTAAGAKAAGMASKEAAAYANRPAFETSPLANVRQNAALAGKVVKRVIPAVGGAISAANIADVATAKNKTGQDVATQVAREAGGLGSAVAGGALGAKAGAALGALGGPMAPITVPAGALLGGIAGGLAANYGANKLMDLGGEAPAETSNGVVTQLFGGNEQAAVDPVRAKHNEILNSGSAAGSIKLPITQSDKRAAFANTDAARRAAANEDSGATMRNGIVSADMGRGFDPTKLQMAPGYGMASNAAGKTLSIGPSQYVAADGSPTSRWEDTQAYQDAIARNERDKMRLAEMQALRLGADPMAVQAASQGIAATLLANEKTRAQMARDAELRGMIKKAAEEQDVGKREQIIEAYLAAHGKDKKQEKDWVMSDGGQDAVDNGMGGKITVNRPPIAFNTKTREVIRLDGSSALNTATGSAPYSDGTRLQGKDGKMYVVRNGVPVLEGK